MSFELIQGNANNLPLDDDSVDLIITSPPYFALRSYRDDGEHYDDQIGSEPTPTDFLNALIACTSEMKRVLKPTGNMFINLGDKYAGAGQAPPQGQQEYGTWRPQDTTNPEKPQRPKTTIRSKSLMGLPWRYALRCIDELNLILRSEIIWHKPNGLPESVPDRTRRNHEQWFHLTKNPRYYSSIDHIREPHIGGGIGVSTEERKAPNRGTASGTQPTVSFEGNPLGRLPGSVWTIPTEPLINIPPHLPQHYAAFPQEWPRKLILGWSPTGICNECGQGRRPVVDIDWDKVPHTLVEKRVLTEEETAEWCASFADWCDEFQISRKDLDAATGTSDMGGWWASRLPHRSQVPTPEQWATIRKAFNPPKRFDRLVGETVDVPVAMPGGLGNSEEIGRHWSQVADGVATLDSSKYKTITGEECDCPTPTAPTTPATVLDPFAGTGTVPGVAHTLGRHGIGIDLSNDYLRLAHWRIAESGHFEKSYQRSAKEGAVLPLTPPPTTLTGQETLWASNLG